MIVRKDCAMRSVIIFIFISISFYSTGQNVYSGYCGEYKHLWTLKTFNDNSAILIRNVDSLGYEEYSGTIKKI